MSGAVVASEEYERLALEMLAVEAGDFAGVKKAMRGIIESAQEEADVAFLLSRALAHAGDQALRNEASLPQCRQELKVPRAGL
jgi:thioredoxin-like negative regulator of GroEL